MFIASKRNFLIPLPDGTPLKIPKDYVGEIPDQAAGTFLVQAAISAGLIFAPQSHKDKDLAAGDEAASGLEAGNDIRPDAPKANGEGEGGSEAQKKAAKKK